MTMRQYWFGETKPKQASFQIEQKRFQKVAMKFFKKIFYWLAS